MKTVETKEVKLVNIQELFPDPNQPRQDFDEDEMKKLKDSIASKGIMNPIVVEPKKAGKYLIVDGERRFRVATQLKMEKVPVNILAAELDVTERNIVRFQLQETHKQWSVFEKAEALSQLKAALDLTTAELASALALSKVTVEHYLSILSFAPKLRKKLTKSKIPFTWMEAMSRTQNIMPEKMAKENEDWIDNVLAKSKRGIIKSHFDFRTINRLIRQGEYKVVGKFLKDNDYTAMNALVDSGDEKTKLVEQILHRARKLTQELQIANKNSISFDAETTFVLTNLAKLL
jgi:ParB/RepB/Spo0J family partition protein